MYHSRNISTAPAQRIALATCKGLLIIYRDEIIRIQSISSYSKLYLANGKAIVVSKVLRWFEDNPDLMGFIRIHRTHLVNADYIERCGIHSLGFVFLSNGEKLKVARRKKVAVMQRLLLSNNAGINKSPALSFHLEQLKPLVA